MTVVAYRDGFMAADSSCWKGAIEVTKIRKIYRVRGGLVGVAGTVNDIMKFIRWLREGADEEEYVEGDYEAIVVNPSGQVTLWEGSGFSPINHRGYCAIGSGADIALGALFVGGSAKDAVRAAIRHNARCTGPLSVWQLTKS